MLKIQKDKIIANGLEKRFENITVINLYCGYLSFSGNIADCMKYENGIEEVYDALTSAGLKGFILQDNNIINLNNINAMCIEFYQYAGISIHKCSRDHAELYHLNIMCKNGKVETIPFRTFKEAEHSYHAIDTALTQLRNEESANEVTSNV